tara:strand:+ start:951 stop:1670 length:720 start_codon:yes stop_codon:yes gene_type:complete
MTFNYPLNFQNEQELIKHVQDNRTFYENILKIDIESKHKKIVDLHSNINTTSSYYIGEFNEQLLQEFISKKFKDWTIDESKKMKCMDIRMYNNKLNLSIGIECKYKKKITKTDITKFISDKSSNKFNGNIFISNSPIPTTLTQKDSSKILNDDLYIFSDNIPFILNYIEVYISTLKQHEDDDNIHIEDINTLFNNHNSQKQQLLKQDKVFLQLIKDEKLLKNHLYLTTKSNCKNSKPPY